MATQIIVGNLPHGVRLADLAALFDHLPHLRGIELIDPDNLTHVSAALTMDLDRSTAQVLVRKLGELHFQGRKLSLWVPLHG